jgi:hypothetical protein
VGFRAIGLNLELFGLEPTSRGKLASHPGVGGEAWFRAYSESILSMQAPIPAPQAVVVTVVAIGAAAPAVR